jgi:hypothetical protein
MLCKHRMGMVCAAMRDSGTAAKLLEETRAHYEAQQAGHDLAREAQLGLAMVALRTAESLPAAQRKERQQELLAQMKEQVRGRRPPAGQRCQHWAGGAVERQGDAAAASHHGTWVPGGGGKQKRGAPREVRCTSAAGRALRTAPDRPTPLRRRCR